MLRDALGCGPTLVEFRKPAIVHRAAASTNGSSTMSRSAAGNAGSHRAGRRTDVVSRRCGVAAAQLVPEILTPIRCSARPAPRYGVGGPAAASPALVAADAAIVEPQAPIGVRASAAEAASSGLARAEGARRVRVGHGAVAPASCIESPWNGPQCRRWDRRAPGRPRGAGRRAAPARALAAVTKSRRVQWSVIERKLGPMESARPALCEEPTHECRRP